MLSYVKEITNMSFNQKSYINEFNKNTYKMYPFRVRKDNAVIIDKLSNTRNINKYITSLIDKDINPNVLTIKQIKEKIRPIMHRHNINDVYLFGSYSRGEANNESDVDIYCEPGDIKSLFDHSGLIEELKEALQKDVDVVIFGSEMSDFFRKQLDIDKIKIC